MPTLASGLRISRHQLGPDETIPQTHRGPHGPSMIRSVKRAIVDIRGIHPTFAFCSFTDVRDGFARDCPHRHPVAPMLALRDRTGAIVGFSGISGEFRRRGARSRDKEGGAGARRGAVSQRSSREPIFGSGLCTPRHPSCGRRMVDRTSARPNAVARVSQQGGWIPAISLECPGSNFIGLAEGLLGPVDGARPHRLRYTQVKRERFSGRPRGGARPRAPARPAARPRRGR